MEKKHSYKINIRKDNKSSMSRSNSKRLRKQKLARVIIRNLSYKTNEHDLLKHFEKYGKITEIQLLKRSDDKLVGCAFIQFQEINQAAKAILKCTNTEFLGRKIYIDWAVGKDKYVKTIIESNNETKSSESEVKTSNLSRRLELQSDISGNEVESEPSEFGESMQPEDSEASDVNDFMKVEENDSDYEDKNKINVKTIKKEKQYESWDDVKDGCTVFLKNVPFEATNYDIEDICQKFGPIVYALVNIDPTSKHSKGTAFVRFKKKESADLLLSKSGDELILMDSILEPYPALSRNDIKLKTESSKYNKNAKNDSRNLYLAKEGLIMANSKAAEGVSASDMAKRHELERTKTQILKNLNRFVSRNRLSIHNLPLSYDDQQLKEMVIKHTNLNPHECRVMRDNKPSVNHPNGKSKGFGFMSFKTHQNALSALRKLNNNPNVFGPKNRPIVAFSIEDRKIHNMKLKRLQKSRESNPTYVKKVAEKGKNKMKQHDKNKILQTKTTKKSTKVPRKSSNIQSFTGTTSKHGEFVRMRSDKKIQEQFNLHAKKVVKHKRVEKQKKQKLVHLKDKQQIDTAKSLLCIAKKNDKFPNLIEKYKKLIDSKAASEYKCNVKIKSKWYVE